MSRSYTKTPWAYFLIRLLFKFVLKIFYGTIVVENAYLIPESGQPWCALCENEQFLDRSSVRAEVSVVLTFSYKDFTRLLVGAVPSNRRNFIRLTAKATQFGKKTFTSWLIEAAGAVPLKRRKDTPDMQVDNSEVMESLKEVLEKGDAVCLFPEGMSRFHPKIAPLKTGVARLVSDVLTRNKDNPNFKLYVQTCSITYTHRQHFRSDVLITFHPPLPFTPKGNPELIAPVDFNSIRALTARIQQQISSGTFDSPTFDIVRSAKLATRIYAPLGTNMSLGDYVRVCRAFVEVFKWAELEGKLGEVNIATSGSEEEDDQVVRFRCALVNDLRQDLKDYQDQLAKLGIKDDRIRRPIPRRTILYRMLVRLSWVGVLLPLCMPGLVLWLPVFATTQYAVKRYILRAGPVWDTWDEIAQTKLVYGLASGLSVWFGCIILTLPIAPITAVVVPAVMWMSLRWMEDAVSAARAFMALARLLWTGNSRLQELYKTREELHGRVMTLAVQYLRLPEDPETYFLQIGGKEKGRVRSNWESNVNYFSVRRRRKRDWNETLRLYDKVDYPDDSLFF